MIIDPRVQRNEDTLRIESFLLYRQYQELNLRLEESKHERLFGMFGYLGFGTLLLTYLLVIIVSFIVPWDAVILIADIFTRGIFPFLVVLSVFKFLQLDLKRDNGMAAMLPDVSEHNYPLKALPYSAYFEYTEAEHTEFLQTFNNPVFTKELSGLEQKPLRKPVIIEGQPVVGVLLRVYLDDNGLMLGSGYHVRLEDGSEQTITKEQYEDMTTNIHSTAEGEEFVVPVLTGRKQNELWKQLGDAVNSARLADVALEGSAAQAIPTLRQAVSTYEQFLKTLQEYSVKQGL